MAGIFLYAARNLSEAPTEHVEAYVLRLEQNHAASSTHRNYEKFGLAPGKLRGWLRRQFRV